MLCAISSFFKLIIPIILRWILSASANHNELLIMRNKSRAEKVVGVLHTYCLSSSLHI